MKKYNIFVSGVQKELKDERVAVKELISGNVLLKEHFRVFLFEEFPAKSKSAKSAYTSEVRKSDIYLGILGKSYGEAAKNKLSPTEYELREAQKGKKDILIYIKGKDDKERDKRVQKLINNIRHPEKGYSYKRFNIIAELQNNIYESLIEFLREKGIVGRTAFDELVCEDATFKDIDRSKVKWLLRVAKNKRNYPIKENVSLEKAFTHLNLLKNGALTNAAILLFGKNPQRYHLQAEIKCIQFAGTEVEKPFSSYHIYQGDLFEQIDRAVAFVLSSIRLPVIQQEETVMVKRPHEIPVFVIQEAIVNAIAHRDYNPTAGVQVMVFIDRVEVWNPGSLPAKLTLKSLRKPHESYPNNPLIARILYLANYIQEAGSGTLEMIKQCKEKGLPEPEFVLDRNVEFRTILARDVFTDSTLMRLGLNERQIKAVKYVKGKRKITNNEYQQINDVSNKTAYLELSNLVKDSILMLVGKGRNASYVLKVMKK